jgi:hypothetical protein
MAKMKPPAVPEQPVPVLPDDALQRLLAACAGKGFEEHRRRPPTRSRRAGKNAVTSPKRARVGASGGKLPMMA